MTLLLGGVASSSAQAAPDPVLALRSRVAELVRHHREETGAPGVSVAVGASGRLWLTEAQGYADLEHAAAATPSTPFRLQSTQKLLTATAVLRLAARGLLRLDDPVQAYCPAFGVRPWPVTVRQLLTHQGGVRPSDLADLFNREHYLGASDALRRFVRDTLATRPGTRVLYSNAGYTLLACALEGAAGRSYDSTLAELVLRPAGMSVTRDDNPYLVLPGRARYYIVRTAKNTVQWQGLWTAAHLAEAPLDRPANAHPVDPSWAIGAGSYLGTPSDLVRFGLALREGDSVFAPAALTETGEPTGRALGGWVIDSSGTTVRMLGSTWNGSFGLAIDLERGIVVAIASNIEFDQPGDLVDAILAACRPLARAATHR